MEMSSPIYMEEISVEDFEDSVADSYPEYTPGTVFHIESIPGEMLVEIFKNLTLEDIYNTELVNKRWRELSKAVKINLYPTWSWSSLPEKKAYPIDISADGLLATRLQSFGHNPSVMATQPLTRRSPYFRVEILKLGKWVGVGVSDENFRLDGSSTLGTQKGCFNSSYFWQNSGIHRLQMDGEERKDASEIHQGCVIDVKADFEKQRICYWLNQKFQGFIYCINTGLEDGKVYPCVNLSSDTTVKFRNQDKMAYMSATLKDVDELEEEGDLPPRPFPTMWKWSATPKKKSNAIIVKEDGMVASRMQDGHNPSVMTSHPFTTNHWYFQVLIKKLGNWIGIGVADTNFALRDSTTLGTQKNGLNAAYFWQDTGIRRLQMNGHERMNVQPLHQKDIVGVRVDFDQQKISFYLNDKLQGTISCDAESSRYQLVSGKVFPCVNLGKGCEVVIKNLAEYPPKPPTSVLSKIKKKLTHVYSLS